MPRIVPSQVVDFISGIQLPVNNGVVRLNYVGSPRLSAVLELVSQIPDELLTMDKLQYASFINAKAEISETLATWTANRTAGHSLQAMQYGVAQNPLEVIRAILASCPDEAPSPSTSELSFILDADLRMNLRNDMGFINRALSNGEWKAATVLGGSAIEALLLWALQQQQPSAIASSITAVRSAGKLRKQPPANLEEWNLHEYTEVAAHLGVIKDDAAQQTRLARHFRNFIHPGVAQRLAQKCDRATALSAVAGMEHVVRDLTP